MKIGWQLTKLLQKLSGLLFWPTLYSAIKVAKTSNRLSTLLTRSTEDTRGCWD